MNGDRLDVFYHLYLASKDGYKNLWHCVQIILCLSHGQAGVERGFSFNKEMTRDNMKEETFVATRAVKDKLVSLGGSPLDVPLTSALLTVVSNARAKYFQKLEDDKANAKNNEKTKNV